VSPLIQRPDVALKLKDRYGLTSMPDSILAPEIVPVTIVDDLSELGVSRACAGRASIGAVAAEIPMCAITQPEPQDSDITIIVRRMLIRASANIALVWGRITEPGYVFTNLITKQFLNQGVPGRPTAMLRLASSPVPIGRIDFGGILRSDLSTFEVLTNVIIPPDQIGLVVMSTGVNVSLEVSFDWDEIPPT